MENRQFQVTNEIMANAKCYMPVLTKEVIAQDVARACIKETSTIGEQTDDLDAGFAMPPVYCESPSSKSRVMMAILLSYYLGVVDSNEKLMLNLETFDGWAGAHVLNQIERFKATEHREKAFNLLSDYREMERYLNSAIYSVLREMNDPVKRFLSTLSLMGTDEQIKKTTELAKKTASEILEEQKRQDKIVNGEIGGDKNAE